jgi:hypothetical protein
MFHIKEIRKVATGSSLFFPANSFLGLVQVVYEMESSTGPPSPITLGLQRIFYSLEVSAEAVGTIFDLTEPARRSLSALTFRHLVLTRRAREPRLHRKCCLHLCNQNRPRALRLSLDGAYSDGTGGCCHLLFWANADTLTSCITQSEQYGGSFDRWRDSEVIEITTSGHYYSIPLKCSDPFTWSPYVTT